MLPTYSLVSDKFRLAPPEATSPNRFVGCADRCHIFSYHIIKSTAGLGQDILRATSKPVRQPDHLMMVSMTLYFGWY
jgi:hypothetical protein